MIWVPLMDRALELARSATLDGDVPVGALVLNRAGDVIGEGRNTRERDQDPAGHAEIVAMREAAAALGTWRLDDCTLIVTLEPCAMCAGTLISARIGHLIFGAFDEKAGAAGSVWDLVRDRRLNHRPQVTGGVMADESSQLLRDFFQAER